MKPLGFGLKTTTDLEEIKRAVMQSADQRFSPEFRNRIDEIVVFSPLTQDEVKQIARLYLGSLARQMERQGRRLRITEAAIDRIVELGFSMAYGARFLKRTIDERVKLPITNLWNEFHEFVVDQVDGELEIRGEQAPSIN